MATLADTLTAEMAAVTGGATACGYTCTATCHGALTCQRATHVHVAGDVTPHLGHDGGGNLIQWVCPAV